MKMNAICISLKGNMNINCGSKITDVAKLPYKMAKPKPKVNDDNGEEVERNPYVTNRFQELGMGEPSRNVVEMIFRASCSSRRSSKKKKIRKVVKVKNPEEVVAKFESYREEVKSTSMEHSRSIVDGNEVLQFYGTTMSCCCCCSRLLSQLCTQPGCRVCRIIESGFNTSYNKMHGIRVSGKSNSMSENSAINGAAKNGKRAVIICRTIAAGGRGVGVGADDDAMVVPNPAAILPCFLVIFD